MVVYYKLFDLLKRRNMKISDLRNVISSATVAKINKGQHISGECIDKICRYLQCQPSDIMEITESETEKKKRQEYETATDTMCEDFYEMLSNMAKSTNKSIKVLWNDYLKTKTQKSKEKASFRILQKYMEERINKSEE